MKAFQKYLEEKALIDQKYVFSHLAWVKMFLNQLTDDNKFSTEEKDFFKIQDRLIPKDFKLMFFVSRFKTWHLRQYFLRITLRITGVKKHRDVGVSLFDVRVHEIVMFLLYMH